MCANGRRVSMSGGGEEAFARSLGRKACAQIVYAQAERLSGQKTAKGTGKGGAKPVAPASIYATESVADALADVGQAFIEQAGRAANARAELAGRTHSNLIDVLAALSRMASVTHTYTRDLARYAMFQEIPFPQTVPEFPALPAAKKRRREPTLDLAIDAGEAPGPGRPHIEPWMPALPSAHTYVATPVYMAADASKTDRTSLSKQRRQVEKSLARLKESQTSGVGGLRSMYAAAAAAPENPFLAPPKVGSGRVFDEDIVDAPREPTEPIRDATAQDAKDSNFISQGARANSAKDQKLARAERLLAEAESGGPSTSAKPEAPTAGSKP